VKAFLKSRTLMGALALAGAFTAPALAGATPCAKWDVSQGWYALQSNDYRVAFTLQQRDTRLNGTGSFSSPERSGVLAPFGEKVVGAVVTGSIQGDSIELQTAWGGVYTGTIEATGRIVGTTFDKRHPITSRTGWSSDRNMKCLALRTPPPGSNDFNGDGRGDILWHNASTGESQIWLMNGSSRMGRATITDGTRPIFIGPPWRIVGSRDFNGDGKSDVLWYNSSTGETQLWFMKGHELARRATVLSENGSPIFIGPPWSIVGTNDMNGDGKSDIIWNNSSTGEIQVWFMNGHTLSGRATVLAEDGSALLVGLPRGFPGRIAGTNDMNGDGKPDIVLHYDVTGITQVFFMNGHRAVSRAAVRAENDSVLATVGLPWRIAGTNDFNRDGTADILWHNGSTGETQMWFMQGRKIASRATVNANKDGGGAQVGLPWRIMNH